MTGEMKDALEAALDAFPLTDVLEPVVLGDYIGLGIMGPDGVYWLFPLDPHSQKRWAAWIKTARAARALLSTDKAVGEWQSIKSAPRNGTEVDLWCAPPGISTGSGRVTDCWYADDNWWRNDGNGADWPVHNATHWMPKPKPPALTASRASKSQGGK